MIVRRFLKVSFHTESQTMFLRRGKKATGKQVGPPELTYTLQESSLTDMAASGGAGEEKRHIFSITHLPLTPPQEPKAIRRAAWVKTKASRDVPIGLHQGRGF